MRELEALLAHACNQIRQGELEEGLSTLRRFLNESDNIKECPDDVKSTVMIAAVCCITRAQPRALELVRDATILILSVPPEKFSNRPFA